MRKKKDCSQDIIYKAFKTKIYPTEEQKEYFKNCFGITRFAYNWIINSKQEYYQLGIKKSVNELGNQFNKLRNTEFPFVYNVNYRVYKLAIENADIAYDRFFKGISNFPKYKNKKDKKQSFNLDRCLLDVNENVNAYKKYKHKFNNHTFYIAGEDKKSKMNGYYIKTSENITFLRNKQIILCTISYDNLNYYVSFTYKEIQKCNYNNHKYDKVGIDLGLKTFAIQSDGKIAKLPKQRIIKMEKRIKKLNQILSKKEYNSNNYNKVKIKLNKCYKQITNIKKDFLNKYTTWLCKNYKEIHIEDLNITNMLKNKRLAKSISRSNFNQFRSMLDYKSKWYNCKLIIIDRYFASSKICHQCGNKKSKLKLSDRIYICEVCEYVEDRDLNAAYNIRDWHK